MGKLIREKQESSSSWMVIQCTLLCRQMVLCYPLLLLFPILMHYHPYYQVSLFLKKNSLINIFMSKTLKLNKIIINGVFKRNEDQVFIKIIIFSHETFAFCFF